MLFLAVFCGFLAEYQLEHYIEKQRAREFALSLHRDLVNDTASFNKTAGQLNICSKNIDSLVSLLSNPAELRQQTAKAYKYGAYAFAFPSSSPNESTLQQLLNSGSLRYFKNNLLVDSIKDYNNFVQLFKEFATSSTDLVFEFRKIQMQFIDINKLTDFLQSGGMFSGLNGKYTLYDLAFFGDSQFFTYDPLRLKEYSNWCSLKKFYLTNTIYRYYSLKAKAAHLLKLLENDYHIK